MLQIGSDACPDYLTAMISLVPVVPEPIRCLPKKSLTFSFLQPGIKHVQPEVSQAAQSSSLTDKLQDKLWIS